MDANPRPVFRPFSVNDARLSNGSQGSRRKSSGKDNAAAPRVVSNARNDAGALPSKHVAATTTSHTETTGAQVGLRVLVRCRPRLPSDVLDAVGKTMPETVRIPGPNVVEIPNVRSDQESVRYSFDAVYGPETTQEHLFNEEVRPMLKRILQGQNASVLAYGPTGAGKTHTMLGSPAQLGVVPRSIKKLFQLVESNKRHADFTVRMSTLEIYNEEIFDLLRIRDRGLPIRQDDKGHIHVQGLSEEVITSYEEFEANHAQAMRNRTTAPTLLNAHSSRSHFMVIIKVTRREAGTGRVYVGTLMLVDLAGSEDNRRTGNIGERMKESGMINKSLLALNTLVSQLNKGEYVNYRQSCLTRLLKECLGGNSHSCMFANIAQGNYLDTVSTLNFAKKGMKIVCKPFVTEVEEQKPKRDVAPLKPATNLGLPERVIAKPLTNQGEVRRSGGLPRPGPGPADTKRGLTMSQYGQLKATQHNLGVRAAGVTKPNVHSKANLNLGALAAAYVEQGDKWRKANKLREALNSYRQAWPLRPECKQLRHRIQALERELGEGDGSDDDYTPSPSEAEDSDAEVRPRKQGKRPPAGGPGRAGGGYEPNQAVEAAEDAPRPAPPKKKAKAAPAEPQEPAVHVKIDDDVRRRLEAKLLDSLNTWSVAKMTKDLKSVGKKRAESIVAARDEKGPFLDLGDFQAKVGFTDKVHQSVVKDNLIKYIDFSA